MEIELTKPIVHNEVEYKKLTLDFDRLTGADVLQCEREAAELTGKPILNGILDPDFREHFAAKAAGLPPEALRKLSARDYMRINGEVQAFLLGGG